MESSSANSGYIGTGPQREQSTRAVTGIEKDSTRSSRRVKSWAARLFRSRKKNDVQRHVQPKELSYSNDVEIPYQFSASITHELDWCSLPRFVSVPICEPRGCAKIRIPSSSMQHSPAQASDYTRVTKDSGYESDSQAIVLPLPKSYHDYTTPSPSLNGIDEPISEIDTPHVEQFQLYQAFQALNQPDEPDKAGETTVGCALEPTGFVLKEARCDTVSQDDIDETIASLPRLSNDTECSVDSSEYSVDTDGAESGNNDEQLVIVMARHRLLQRLMQEFYSMLNSFLTDTPQDSPENSTENVQTTPRTERVRSSQPNAPIRGKKRLERDDEDEPEEDGFDDRKKRPSNSKGAESDDPLLACPFYKYDPRKYTCTSSTRTKYRTCTGPGFDSIARLKQHLKRNHSAPIQCLRCWEIFPDHTALAAHSRSEVPCQVLPLEVVEGISQQKFDRMKRWGSTWNEIFTIIFPGASPPESFYHEFEISKPLEVPPSPCSQDLAKYEAYARTELPRLVEANLEALIRAETEPLEEKLKPLLVGVVRDCQSTLGRRWNMIKEKRPDSANSSIAIQLPTSGAQNSPPKYRQPFMRTNHAMETPSQDIFASSNIVEASYQEPRLLSPEESSATAEAFERSHNISKEVTGDQRPSDSGYGTLVPDYLCLCDQLFGLSSHATATEQDLFPIAEPGTMLEPAISTIAELRPKHSASIADLQSQDQDVQRCAFCRGFLPPASCSVGADHAYPSLCEES